MNLYGNCKQTKSDSKTLSKWNRLVKHGQDYADESSIDGVKYFGGTATGHYSVRIVWFVIFGISVGLGLFIFYPIWQQYMNKATQNLVEYIEPEQFQFPSISFRNLNSFRKSIIGENYAAFLDFKPDFRHNISTDGKRMCFNQTLFKRLPKTPEIQKYIVGPASRKFANVSVLTSEEGYIGMVMISTSTSMQSIQMCRFQGITLTDEECYASFQNRITNNGYYFTFNPSQVFRNFTIMDIARELNLTDLDRNIDSTFPTPLKEIVDFTVNSRGRATAVEFLLNTQQHEYCDAGANGGAGFEMQIHSRNVQPVIYELMDDVIQLTPGTEVTITIREHHIVREIESAGWCTSKMNLEYFKHLEKYDKNACITECVSKKLKEKCNCVPEFAPTTAFIELAKAKAKLVYQWNLTRRESAHYYPSKVCTSSSNRKCVRDEMRTLIVGRSLSKECSLCKIPCFERNYLIQKTENAFPSQNAMHLYRDMKHPRINYTALLNVSGNFLSAVKFMLTLDPREYNLSDTFASLDEMRQNLIYLRIQLEDMTIQVSKETFAISTSQLLTQLGGAISLFIGASVLSLIECIYWVVVPTSLRHRNS